MTTRRRLVVVGAGLAVATILTSYLWSDSATPERGRLVPPDSSGKEALQAAAKREADFARSRFAQNEVLSYQSQDGGLYFSLQVKPDLEKPAAKQAARPRDYLFLVTTSASMGGASLNSAKQMAKALAETASPKDRLDLWVVSTPDKATYSLTHGMKPAVKDGKLTKEAADAFKELDRIVPMADTDLGAALNRALITFDQEGRQRILVYFGDGMSLHRRLEDAERTRLAKEMVQKHIVFYPVPLGDHINSLNLHGLEIATGGAPLRVRIFDEKVSDAVERARAAFEVPVLYPTHFALAGGVAEHYPQADAMPPLRSDSPTLVIGRLQKGAKELTYSVTGKVDGQEGFVTRTHKAVIPAAEPDNFFLVSMVAQWQNRPAEFALIRADRALAFAAETARLRYLDLIDLAQQAMQQDKLDAAGRLFDAARRLAPHDGEAKAGLKLLDLMRRGKVSRDSLRKEMEKAQHEAVRLGKGGKVHRLTQQEMEQLAQADKAEMQPPKGGGRPAPDGADLLKEQRARIVVEEQKMSRLVEGALARARGQLPNDPEGAHRLLRDTLLLVETNPDLGDRVRVALTGRLENELRNVALRGREILDERAQRQQLAEAAQKANDRQALIKADQDKTESRLRAWKALLNFARYDEVATRQILEGMLSIQREAKIAGTPVPQASQATYMIARARNNLQKLDDLKALRAERFLQIMMDVEKTFVPFSDEPPIHFPSLPYWKALAKMRKQKYEVQSLPDDPAGRAQADKISKMLESDIDLKGVDEGAKLKLKDVLELISTRLTKLNQGKEVLIILDVNAFKAEKDEVTSEGILGTEIDLPAFPKRMAMATLLRIALGNIETKNASYVIRKNFVEITTNDRVVSEKVLRVYPVAELVMPIKTQMMLGAQGGGAGFTSMGGFQGFGGQMMGMAGGMMGMAGGMMGMAGGMMGMAGGMMGMAGGMMGMGGMNMMGMGGMAMMGGGMNMMGMGGMNMMGMGGMNMMGMGGMNMMGMGGGMMMGMGGQGMMGMAGMAGGFNSNLGFMGATQAMPLIMVITSIVAPGEWFKSPAQIAAENMQGGFGGFNGFNGMGAGMMGGMPGMGGMNMMGMNPAAMGGGMNPGLQNFNQGPPLLPQQGQAADIRNANTIQFFAPALALIVRAPTRIHYKATGGVIGPKKTEAADKEAALGGRGNDLAKAGGIGGKLKVAGREDQDDDAPGPRWVAGKGKPGVGNGKGKKIIEPDPATCWEEPISKSGGDPGLIIATADFLFENGKYEHAAEFLKTNLRLGVVVKPWVYEALAVAMEQTNKELRDKGKAEKYAPDEIRRARLSSVALNPEGVEGFLVAARTMAEQREWDRALAYCKEAAHLTPALSRPYAEALSYAESAKDVAAMQWAAGKLLGQDWAGDNDGLHKQAQAKLWALAGVLNNQGRKADADQLLATLQKLRERDLVINLSWQPGASGPAEFELEVKEPGGSICSSQFRLSPGGGTLVGGTLKQITRMSYVAAQGFSGDYQVTVRRLWGEPLGNAVRVEVVTHQGTAGEHANLKTIKVGKTQTFAVSLSGGRRTTPAAVPPPGVIEQEAQGPPPKSGYRILQVLRKIADEDFSGYNRGFSGGVGGPAAARISPVIQTDDHQSEKLAFQAAMSSVAGVNLTTRATVSADQQTVRLTLIPDFTTPGGRPTAILNLPLIPGGTDR
jgi:hypothetical protein